MSRAGANPAGRVLTAAVLMLLVAPPGHARLRENLEDYLQNAWYATEVIVFQRPSALEYLDEERLVQTAPRQFPAGLSGLTDPWADTAAGDDAWCWPLRMEQYPPVAANGPENSRLRSGEDDVGDLNAAISEPDRQTRPDLQEASQDPGAEEAAASLPVPVVEPVLAPDPLLDFLAAVAAYEASLERQSYTWLPDDSLTLSREAGRLARAPGYQVLQHGRWLQPVPPRDAPQPLLIQAGTRLEGGWQLEGTLDLSLGRYLHFNARLWYYEPLLGAAPISVPLAAGAGNPGPSPEPATGAGPESLPAPPAGAYLLLAESRRMRSGELHYLDHPKFGVLVRSDPVPLPQSLIDRFAELKALEQSDQ
ncbi:MAG: CsiV family protein [Pseudomonadales bacterium]